MGRIDRSNLYMLMALLVAGRSTCKRMKAGCVLVNQSDHKLRAIGYNGAPSGVEHCTDKGCLVHKTKDGPHCISSIHAEINSLSQLRGEHSGLIAYISHQPCYSCYQALVAFGVKKIFFNKPYEDLGRKKLEEKYGVPLYQLEVNLKDVG